MKCHAGPPPTRLQCRMVGHIQRTSRLGVNIKTALPKNGRQDFQRQVQLLAFQRASLVLGRRRSEPTNTNLQTTIVQLSMIWHIFAVRINARDCKPSRIPTEGPDLSCVIWCVERDRSCGVCIDSTLGKTHWSHEKYCMYRMCLRKLGHARVTPSLPRISIHLGPGIIKLARSSTVVL